MLAEYRKTESNLVWHYDAVVTKKKRCIWLWSQNTSFTIVHHTDTCLVKKSHNGRLPCSFTLAHDSLTSLLCSSDLAYTVFFHHDLKSHSAEVDTFKKACLRKTSQNCHKITDRLDIVPSVKVVSSVSMKVFRYASWAVTTETIQN